MKKLAITILLSAAIIACNKEETTKKSGPEEIRFSVSQELLTKSYEETTAITLEDGFRTRATMDTDKSTMFDAMVTRTGGEWKPAGGGYHFPQEGTLSFHAVYPAEQTIETDSQGNASLTYDAAGAETDLVTAYRKNISGTEEPVQLSFKHVLSRVQFLCRAMDESYEFKLTELQVSAPKGGTYKYESDTWEPQDDMTFTLYSGTGTDIPSTDATPLGTTMTFIPGEITIKACWTCTNISNPAIYTTSEETVTTTLEQGTAYQMTLLLPKKEPEVIIVDFGTM